MSLNIDQVTSGSLEIYKNKGACKFYFAQARLKKIGQNKQNGQVVGERYTVDRTGSIIVDVCPSIPPKNRNDLPTTQWDRKITFSLGVNDIIKLLEYQSLLDRLMLEFGNMTDAVNSFAKDKYPKTTLSLTHKYTARDGVNYTKRMQFKPGVGNYEGTFQMSMSSYTGDDYKNSENVTVPFSAGEFAAFMILIRESLPDVLLWGNRAMQASVQMSSEVMLTNW